MEAKILIVLHVLGASVWVGGHLVLCLTVLPRAWKEKNIGVIQDFENPFEKIGIPALLVQVITGIWLALIHLPFSEWSGFESPASKHIGLKLFLLLLTFLLAIHARFFIIPKLTPDKISSLGGHIIAITIVSVLLLIAGVSFRYGIIF